MFKAVFLLADFRKNIKQAVNIWRLRDTAKPMNLCFLTC
jgi:hypothetical protein